MIKLKTKPSKKAGNGASSPASRKETVPRGGAAESIKKIHDSQSRGSGASPVLKEVQNLYEFMQQNKLASIEFSKDDTHVKLVRMPPVCQYPPQISPETALSAAKAQLQEKRSDPGASSAHEIKGGRIKSPMTGIFYRAPSPSSPPFAKEGDTVRSGQVLCIIEAMKVFNEIKAETDCVISKVLVENGKPVATNQELFAIEKK